MLNDDLQQDRRLIMKKMHARSMRQSIKDTTSQRRRQSDLDYYNDADNDLDEELLYEVQAAHEQHQEDEEIIGGRMEYGDEGLDALNNALTSPPTTWWAMRSQWQKKKGNMIDKFEQMKHGGGNNAPSENHVPSPMDDARYDEGGEDHQEGIDASYGSGSNSMRSRLGLASNESAGLIGHPVLLEDPSSIGYDSSAYQTNPYALNPKKNKGGRIPSVMYVSRDTLQKRQIAQISYLVAAICIIFLFMFTLEQRKLSHYAMVSSPITLTAYLMEQEEEEEPSHSFEDLGLEQFKDIGHIPQVEFGNIEVNPNDPLANEELANDPLVGNFQAEAPDQTKSFDPERFELLKKILVDLGVTPDVIFENLSSPQFKALHWLANDDVLQYTPDNEHEMRRIIQRYALVTLYYSTNGEGWTNTLKFLSNEDECNWNELVEVGGFFAGAGQCEDGFITTLALWSNNLDGSEYAVMREVVSVQYLWLLCLTHIIFFSSVVLPPEIGALTFLRILSVFDNRLHVIPPKSLTKLKSLEILYLQKNEMEGDLSYLCPSAATDFKSDCGKAALRNGGMTCSCCTSCGYSARNDKERMHGEP